MSNTRSLPAHTHREHLPLDAILFYELSFSNFPLLYSSPSGVLCHPTAGAEHRVLSLGRHNSRWKPQTQLGRPPKGRPAEASGRRLTERSGNVGNLTRCQVHRHHVLVFVLERR